MAAIPFAAKTLVGHIADLALVTAKSITLQEMVEDFCNQMATASQIIENTVQSGATSVVIHCRTEKDAEVLLNTSLCFQCHPLRLVPAPSI